MRQIPRIAAVLAVVAVFCAPALAAGSIAVSGVQERPVARAIETALGARPGDAADQRRRERCERRE